ncbi:MAG: excinuclease ABC subunit UvrA, partial [Oscillospiraceae bacterium]|nr:excinuclease ABC subunit UvrA [Oscillospiraceae bacterium]
MLDKIVIKGARVHNLKNIDLEIPRDKFVVVTGISGSGKSSLAFDTIYAEGQRRYVESLSAYARQFLGQMDKPDVDYIGGLSPAIAIDQKTTSKNPRSTVGTVTEIYDYLRLLFARIGTPHCPHCNKEIASQSIDQIVDSVMQFPEGTKLQILAPVLVGKKGENRKVFDDARRAGYARVRVDGVQYDLDDDIPMAKTKAHNVEVIVDRLVMKEDVVARLSGSIETALAQGEGVVIINIIDVAPTNNEEVITNNYCRILQAKFIKFRKNRKKRIRKNSNHSYSLFVIRYSLRGQSCDHIYSTHYACPNCDVSIGELTPRSFSFNSPFGACTECSGIGHLMTVDPALVVRNEKLSLNKGAISVSGWNSHQSDNSIAAMYYNGLAKHYGFSLDTPWEDLPQKIQDILLYGSGNTRVNFKYERNHGKGEYSAKFEGVVNNLQRRYRETNSSWMRMEIEMLMSNNECPSCKGFRLAPVPLAVTIGNKNIIKITNYSIEKAFQFFEKLKLNKKHEVIAAPILKEIKARLGFLTNVGLDYLTLARSAGSLSGGEAQRIRLATQIGSYLQGVLYVLDEPSIGLHQRDNAKLIASLRELCDIGNSLIVVEHDEETMKAADWIIDVGPAAGI